MTSPVSIIITGANGQLGRSFRDVEMPDHFHPHYFTRAELDITDPEAVERAIAGTPCNVFINCAAYTQVDKAESEVEVARIANSEAVSHIARTCAKYGTILVQLSTDYVYDQAMDRPFRETDPVNPQSVYASTKLAGESAALEFNPASVVIRTSWVFSDYGHNFVKTMLRLAKAGRSLRVVSDQVGCPTYATDLARAIVQVIQVISNDGADLYGIYNFSNSEATNWHDFAAEIFRQSGYAPELTPVPTSEYITPAKRPLYSVMDTSKFTRVFGITPRSWREALQDCLPRVIPD